MRKKIGANRCQPIDERFQMADVSEIVRQQIARLFTERFRNTDEILHIQAALTRFKPGQMRRGDPHASSEVSLTACLRFTKLPKNAAVHASQSCTHLAI